MHPNPTVKPIAWSHSSLKDFEGCARRYHETKILKKYPFVESEEMKYGNLLHKAVENYIKGSADLDEKFAFMRPIVDKLKAKKGRVSAETKMALTANLEPCDWFDKRVWVRGIADMLIIDDDDLTAWVIDWKTGNNKYPDRDQLALMACMVFKLHPHIRKVNAALMFVLKDDMVKMSMTHEESAAKWWEFRERYGKLLDCVANDVWNPTQTPLCGWCPVKTCEFNTKRKD